VARDDSRGDGVDGRAVACCDVEPEVEVALELLPDEVAARVVEEAADRVRAVERLERPRIRAGARGRGERCERDGERDEESPEHAPDYRDRARRASGPVGEAPRFFMSGCHRDGAARRPEAPPILPPP
jgi:hypothetical protein